MTRKLQQLYRTGRSCIQELHQKRGTNWVVDFQTHHGLGELYEFLSSPTKDLMAFQLSERLYLRTATRFHYH